MPCVCCIVLSVEICVSLCFAFRTVTRTEHPRVLIIPPRMANVGRRDSGAPAQERRDYGARGCRRSRDELPSSLRRRPLRQPRAMVAANRSRSRLLLSGRCACQLLRAAALLRLANLQAAGARRPERARVQPYTLWTTPPLVVQAGSRASHALGAARGGMLQQLLHARSGGPVWRAASGRVSRAAESAEQRRPRRATCAHSAGTALCNATC